VTIISPWQIMWGKLISGLRVSSVLTSFLLWPLLLACVMVSYYWTNLAAIAGYLAIVALTCFTTAELALFCSVIFRKTSVSMMTAYALIIVLFTAPVAMRTFAEVFYKDHWATELVKRLSFTSPFTAAFSLPLDLQTQEATAIVADWPLWWSFVLFYVVLDAVLVAAMIWLFRVRWRVSH
jgi:ABC-type transport system involved in multi-copper enzyme maturation permease subunit